MAYTPNETNLQRLSQFYSGSLSQRLSRRHLKGIVVFLVLCSVLAFLLLWQPAYHQLRSLQKEKIYWQHVLKAGPIKLKTEILAFTIPTMDQLPDLIDHCCGAFRKENVDVATFNVERFGERLETGSGARLDYGLVRLHLRGNWERIVSSLQALEKMPAGNIHLQEVVLNAEGGEVLLRIYFCTGE